MQIEKYTDRLKALVQSAQSLALRSGHQQLTPLLGVKKNASQDESQKAYRRLAKKLHPDLNPGNKQAEERFKEISAAYDLLGDPDKRARFDRGVNDEGIPVVLDLVDQIYGLRRMLRGLLSTMKAQQQERERA